MKTPIKIFLFLSLLASIPLQAANERDTLPENLLGNWINTSNQEWEYGFFENFAIYRSDFWDYKKIEKRGKNIRIVLEKEGQEVDLSIRNKEGKPLFIAANGEEGQEYASFLKGFIPYQLPDTLRFEEPNITMDSVTILGYYRNLDRVKPELSTAGESMKLNWHMMISCIGESSDSKRTLIRWEDSVLKYLFMLLRKSPWIGVN